MLIEIPGCCCGGTFNYETDEVRGYHIRCGECGAVHPIDFSNNEMLPVKDSLLEAADREIEELQHRLSELKGYKERVEHSYQVKNKMRDNQ